MSNIDKYINFIAEQVRRESTVGLRGGVINEDSDKWTKHLSAFGKHMAKFEDNASGHPSEHYDTPAEAKKNYHPTFDPEFAKMKDHNDVHDHYAYHRDWENDRDFKPDIKRAVAHAKKFKSKSVSEQDENTVGLRGGVINEAKINTDNGSDHAIEVMGKALKKDGITIKNHGSIGDADKLTFHKDGKKIGEHHVDWKDGAKETARGIHDQVKAHTNLKLTSSGDYIHYK